MTDGFNPKEIGVIGLNEHRLRMAEAVQAAIEQERVRFSGIVADHQHCEESGSNCAALIQSKILEEV